MKKTLITISLFTLLSTSVFADNHDAPPSLNINFGDLLGPEENQDEQPPQFNQDLGQEDFEDSEEEDNSGVGSRISNLTATPNTFNPLIQDTTISYRITQNAKVDVEIFNSNGQKIVTLISENLQSGNHSIKWRGTTNNQREGQIVNNGEYIYKVTSYNTVTNVATDSKQGTVIVRYSAAPPAENYNPNPAPRTTVPYTGNANAILTVQNGVVTRTAETGPAVLLYGLLPIAGYYISRKRK